MFTRIENQKKPQLLLESDIGMVVLERLMVVDERRAAEQFGSRKS
jgi:hypothetical protein